MIKAAFIHVPKTGGTSIKSMFKGLLFNMQHGPLSGYEDAFAAKHGDGWGGLYKFAFVRNPWARYVSFFEHHRNAWLRRGVMDDEYDFEGFITKVVPASVIRNQNPGQMFGDGTCELNDVFQYEQFEYGIRQIGPVLRVAPPKMKHINQSPMPRPSDWRSYYDSKTHDAVAEFGSWEIERFGYTFDDCARAA